MPPRKPALDLEAAETLALQALRFLASDADRLARFLALTGIGPGELMAGAGRPEVLASVLDHLLMDESLLLVFAAEHATRPELIGYAHALLARDAHLRSEP